MKLENLKDITKAGEEYERAKSDLEFIRDKCVYFSRPSGAPTTVVASSDVSEYMVGPSGQLASDIKAALVRYYGAHFVMATTKLKKLGVEINAKK